MVMNNTTGYGDVLHDLLLPFDRLLDDLLDLNVVLDLDGDHLSPLNGDSLLVFTGDVLSPLNGYLLLSLDGYHLYSFLGDGLHPLLLNVLGPFVDDVINNLLGDLLGPLLGDVFSPSLLNVVSPLLGDVVNNLLSDVINLGLILYLGVHLGHVLHCVKILGPPLNGDVLSLLDSLVLSPYSVLGKSLHLGLAHLNLELVSGHPATDIRGVAGGLYRCLHLLLDVAALYV